LVGHLEARTLTKNQAKIKTPLVPPSRDPRRRLGGPSGRIARFVM
jgi:hypothetical protein